MEGKTNSRGFSNRTSVFLKNSKPKTQNFNPKFKIKRRNKKDKGKLEKGVR